MSNLTALRTSRNLTLHEVAIAVGISEKVLERTEDEPLCGQGRTLLKLADFYNSSMDTILDRPESY